MEKTIRVNGDEFVLVEAESLSMNDEFMKFEPKTNMEKNTSRLISEAIREGVKNFYRPKCDPSFLGYLERICFVPGKTPAVGKSYNWWERTAKDFCPERSSRLGTRLEYFAFLGVLIKKLVERGWEVATAWNAVCNDSRNLGNYWNFEGSRHNWEPTGSRCICGFCDLVNIYKLLAEDKEAGGFWLAGSNYCGLSWCNPLANIEHYDDRVNANCASTGWVVLEK